MKLKINIILIFFNRKFCYTLNNLKKIIIEKNKKKYILLTLKKYKKIINE